MTPVQNIVLALTDLKHWTWRAVLAVTLMAIAFVVPRLVSTTLGVQEVLDAGNVIGGLLLLAEIARARQETPPKPVPPNERGQAVLEWLVVVLMLVGAGFAISAVQGCASREIVTPNPIEIECWEGPPCRCHITDGDTEPYIVRNPKGSPLTCSIKVP